MTDKLCYYFTGEKGETAEGKEGKPTPSEESEMNSEVEDMAKEKRKEEMSGRTLHTAPYVDAALLSCTMCVLQEQRNSEKELRKEQRLVHKKCFS